jgi:transcriptional regulator with XRE-family HTH domain
VETVEVPPRARTIPEDNFQARLVLTRMHAGDLTIRDAAARCGLNYGSWANWERGMKPRDLIEVAEAISEGLWVDRDWLLFGGPLAQPERRGPRTITRRRRINKTSSPPAVRTSGPRSQRALLAPGHATGHHPTRAEVRRPAITHHRPVGSST